MKIKQPRYDDVFFEGVASLDADARGEQRCPVCGDYESLCECPDINLNHNAPPTPEG